MKVASVFSLRVPKSQRALVSSSPKTSAAEHTTSKGETKTPDEMTVKELHA